MSFVFKKVNAGKPAKQLTLVEQVFSWGSYLYAKSARSGWVLGTSMLLLVFPLWLDIQREMSLQEYEQQMIELFVTSLFLFAFSLIIRKKKKNATITYVGTNLKDIPPDKLCNCSKAVVLVFLPHLLLLNHNSLKSHSLSTDTHTHDDKTEKEKNIINVKVYYKRKKTYQSYAFLLVILSSSCTKPSS